MAKPRYRYALHSRIIAVGHRSVKSFVNKIGLYPATMSEIINGHRYPSPNHLRAIAGGLHCTLAEVEVLLDT
jgi:hypothetical protein